MNPYQAPQAAVHDPSTGDGPLAAEPRPVEAGRGVAWIVEGWNLFKQAALTWVGLTLVGLVIFIVLAFVPFVGQLATWLLSILFGGGIMLGCRALDRGQELTVGHLFAGIQSHLSPLLVIAALYLGAMLVLMLIASLVGGGAILAGVWGGADPGAATGTLLLAILVFLLLLVPVAMAVWFAPGLSTLNNVPPVDALKLSFVGCLRNIVPFLVYGVLLFLIGLAASIPFGLGWLVALPVMAGSVYAAYKDIFLQH
jgi:hypothetical protein